MPKKTYTQINSVTLAATTSSVTFASIPQNFRDLVLVISGTASIATGITITHNGDTTNANYTSVVAYGNGTSATSSTATNRNMISLFTQQSMGIIQFLDYSATDKHKTALARSDSASNETYALARRWANTAAITSLELGLTGGTFASATSFTLYGIEA
jgi:hypothetical protein